MCVCTHFTFVSLATIGVCVFCATTSVAALFVFRGVTCMGKKVVLFSNVSDCELAEKRYVNKNSLNFSKDYEKGDFARAFCLKQSEWCDCETAPEYCPYLSNYLK